MHTLTALWYQLQQNVCETEEKQISERREKMHKAMSLVTLLWIHGLFCVKSTQIALQTNASLHKGLFLVAAAVNVIVPIAMSLL